MGNSSDKCNRLLQATADLIRWDKPVGTWLLFWPCSWGIALACATHNVAILTMLYLFALFFLGALVMRSAGCIINDLWDKDFDAQVERTKNRPLASGQMQVREAIIILALLLTIALAILLQLRMEVFWFAVASLPLVVLYPLMKRITWWPQAFLGLTFNFGALMGWVAVTGTLELSAILLYLCGIFWTLGYDTIYAFQDIEDDAKIGVKSTALRFKERPKQAISLFFTLSYLAFFAAILTSTSNGLTLLASLFFLGLLIAQIISFNQLDRGNCQRQFKQHSLIGLSNLIILLLNFLH